MSNKTKRVAMRKEEHNNQLRDKEAPRLTESGF
ncbi:hypothetical protein E1A91_D02G199200v1 [Gossypium mustelinum]|uniref:Uncharacterized protein n=1 Tax=Gossypium mustelinum TaxID=34275 RepID=A0A5D2VZ06_GOSMU|nr:hypothetical protein E1A91_D02G199200v1 [Gossypium mustelinum]